MKKQNLLISESFILEGWANYQMGECPLGFNNIQLDTVSTALTLFDYYFYSNVHQYNTTANLYNIYLIFGESKELLNLSLSDD